ncbi:hypothetical protein [Hydrogenimonas sp.]
MDKEKMKIEIERRSFLKKSAYVVPTIIGLGYLGNPSSANAMGCRSSCHDFHNPCGHHPRHHDASSLSIRRRC